MIDPVGHLYAALGDEKLRAMCAAFYRRVPEDDILGPMYPKSDMAGAEERLADFIVGRLGGPNIYMEKRGHPRLRMRHNMFVINDAARDRWMELMGAAVEEVEIAEQHATPLMAFFGDVADMMRNSPNQ